MKRAEEKRLLISVLANLDTDTSESIVARAKREICMLAVGVLFAIVVLGTFIEPNIYKVLLGILAFAVGLMIGFMSFRRYSAKQWPVVAKCIDRSKVEARLRELDA